MQINYFNERFLEFDRLMGIYFTGVNPTYTLTDAIEKHMESNQTNHFTLPASKSKDNVHHTFYFTEVKGKWEFDRME